MNNGVFDEPAWRLWQTRNNGHDDQREYDLECYGEAP